MVGKAFLFVASKLSNSTVCTALSFTVPYAAYLPAEHIEASGLVARSRPASSSAPGRNHLSAAQRMSDVQNWRTLELLLEGGVFLPSSAWRCRPSSPTSTATAAACRTRWWSRFRSLWRWCLLRAVFVGPMALWLARRARRVDRLAPKLREFGDRLPADGRGKMRRVNRKIADVDYYVSSPLGWRESTIVVWAGMRGAVTVAAAQNAARRYDVALAAGPDRLPGGRRIVDRARPYVGTAGAMAGRPTRRRGGRRRACRSAKEAARRRRGRPQGALRHRAGALPAGP